MRHKHLEDFERIEKPWGYEVLFAKSSGSNGYIGKLLYIDSGERLSMQYHEKKEETIFIKSGTLYLQTFGDIRDNISHLDLTSIQICEIELVSGEIYHIPPFFSHRFIAKETDVEIIEISTNHLKDTIRISDDYGRV